MNPIENGNHPKNDIFSYADKLADDPKYSEGASLLRDMTQALIERGYLPETILIQGVDSEIEPVEEDPVYHHPLFEHDRRDGRVKYDGKEEKFTPTENDIVKVLEKTPNIVVVNATINGEVFGYPDFKSPVLLKGHMASIKRKIPFWGEDGKHEVIRTVNGVGYEFKDNSTTLTQKEHDGVVYLHRLFELHADQYMLRVDGRDIPLTKLEKDLVEMLVKHPGWVVPTAELMSAFNPNRYRDEVPNPASLKTHMSHIRAKIRDGREIDEPIIEAKKNIGYRLNP